MKEEDGLFSFNRTHDKSMLCLHFQEMHFLTFKCGVITEGQYKTKKKKMNINSIELNKNSSKGDI